MPTKKSQSVLLPTSCIEPLEFFWEHPICVYGAKGVGKSTFGSVAIQAILPDDRKALNFRFERGRRNLKNIYQVPMEKGRRLDWELFKDCLEEFCDHNEFYLAVIDSLDICYEACYSHICSEWGVEKPSDHKEPYNIWDSIKIEFDSTFSAIRDCDKNFCLLSHEKVKRETMADGSEYERLDMSCRPAAAKIAKEQCEFLFYYGYVGQTFDGERKSDRVLTIRNMDNSVECSTGRGDVFLQPDGKPLCRFDVPNDPEKVGQRIQDAYDGKVWEYGRDIEQEERQASRRASKRAALPKTKTRRTKKTKKKT